MIGVDQVFRQAEGANLSERFAFDEEVGEKGFSWKPLRVFSDGLISKAER
jgi:hypothetical protein